MQNNSIQNDIYKIIYDTAYIKPTSNSQPLWHSDEMDSLDCLNIVLQCENKFHINITDDEMKKLVTIGDLVNLVERKTQTIESKLIAIGDTINTIKADTIRRAQILNHKIKGM